MIHSIQVGGQLHFEHRHRLLGASPPQRKKQWGRRRYFRSHSQASENSAPICNTICGVIYKTCKCKNCLVSASECVENRLAELRWEGAYITPKPPSWIYGEDWERRGKRKGRERQKKREREKGNGKGNVKRESKNRRRKNEVERDGRREGKGQEGRWIVPELISKSRRL